MKKLVFLSLFISALTLMFVSTPSASAATNCIILLSGTTLTLQNDCFTDTSIMVPNGVTFDGAGHTITAQDPVGGHFLGAVITNAPGATLAYVTNVKITTTGLADVCDAAGDRLRGILFDGAGGVISNNQITNLFQGAGPQPSGCQEGNAIEVRNAPFDKSGTKIQVTVSNNQVVHYQKTGIAIIGSVDASVHDNVVQGFGPISTIAQNGIQISFGSTAAVTANIVTGNNYAPSGTYACGILIYQADGVRLQNNLFTQGALPPNEKNTCVDSKGGTYDPYGNGQAH